MVKRRALTVAALGALLGAGLPAMPWLPVPLAAAFVPQPTTRVSVSSTGAQSVGGNSLAASISADARFVAFISIASNLVPGDTNNTIDIFVHDRLTGETSRVSVSSTGAQSNGYSLEPVISADGRYVAFASWASNLVPDDTNNLLDNFAHDRVTGATTRVSVSSEGVQGNGHSRYRPAISPDGRYVAFSSSASNLVPSDQGWSDIFVHDLVTRQTERVSLTTSGGQATGDSYAPAISAGGSFVAFYSAAENLVTGDSNTWDDVFVRDRQAGQTSRVSVSSAGAQGNFSSSHPAISDDGRYVAFSSLANNLVPNDTNRSSDVFRHDRRLGLSTRVSVSSAGVEASTSSGSPAISADGRVVAFGSSAPNLVQGDGNGERDVFVHDAARSLTSIASVSATGFGGNSYSVDPSVSSDGRFVAFSSAATNLVPLDTNAAVDVFVRDGPAVATVPPEQTFGTGIHGVNPSDTDSDPVNTATGSFTLGATDMWRTSVGVPFAFTRTYNSADTSPGPLGPGWSHPFTTSLAVGPSGDVALRGEDGQQLLYRLNPDGSLEGAAGARSVLRAVPGGYELVRTDQTRYRFDSSGRLERIADRNDQGLDLSYGPDGRPATVTDAGGSVAAFTHDGSGLVTSIALSDGRRVSFGYTDGWLTSVVDARGGTTTYGYDQNGRLNEVKDPRAQTVVRNKYSMDGRVAEQTDALGEVTKFSWEPITQTSTMTDTRGNRWQDVYSGNVLIKRVDPLGATTHFQYDADLNLAAVSDARGHTWTMTYDERGNLLTRTSPAPFSIVETYTYDARNNVLTATDGRGGTAAFSYDARGNLVRTTEPGGVVTAFGRDPGTGLLASITDPRGKTTTIAYRRDGGPVSVTSPLGNRMTMSYDAGGRRAGLVDPAGSSWSFTYDAQDRILSRTDPLGHATTYSYDAAGNLVRRTDAKGRETAFTYDAANQLTAVTAPDGTVTTYGYDTTGNLVRRTHARGRTTTYSYDASGRLVAVADPLGRRWTYGYDEAGNVVSVTDARGNETAEPGDGTVKLGHDALGRLESIDYADDTPDVSFTHDASGNRASMTDGAGTETYAYEPSGRLSAVGRGGAGFSYDYDAAGNVVRRTYPDGMAAEYTYDDDGRMTDVRSGGATTRFAWDAAGRPAATEFPNGVREARSYDATGRPSLVRHSLGPLTVGLAAYTYDEVGNPLSVTTREATTTYAYDALDRLTRACTEPLCPDELRYTYDEAGNRTSESRGPLTTTYTYDEADQLVAGAGPAGATTYEHDANGNMVRAGSRSFAYDLAGRLRSATSATDTTTYTYDGDSKRLSAGATRFAWDRSWDLPRLAVETAQEARRYVYGPGLVSVSSGPTPLSSAPASVSSATSYYHADALGSVLATTSAHGTPQSLYSYEPFGESRSALQLDPTAPSNPMRFAGEYLDPTGLYHLRARQYDPGLGRFLTHDPLPNAINDPYVSGYIYTNNRPTSRIDPSGLRGIGCRTINNASTTDFLLGFACPPAGFVDRFGYVPQLVQAPNGWRYIRPSSAKGECSAIPDTGPFWDFQMECKTHDYGYDLVRFGVANRHEVDDLLLADMQASCDQRGFVGRNLCARFADGIWSVLQANGAINGPP